ncbi:unnamed protein product, partial [marine sediment metagenome]
MKEYKVSGKEIMYRVCPFCGNDRYNLSVNFEKGVYHAWCCGKGGRISGLKGLIKSFYN